MPIKVIDNFEVNVTKPIDNRFVVGPQSFYTNRDSIPYKYSGLRIWDLNDSLPYVWTGATWSNETAAGTVIGSGSSGYLTKFVGSSPTSTIGDSTIFESGGNVAIGTLIFGSPVAKLQVGGIIRTTTGGFYGDGSNITGINGANITNGSVTPIKIANGSNNSLLASGLSTPEWKDPLTITVGSINIIQNSDNSDLYIPFVSGDGSQQLKVNTTANSIRINPSNGAFRIDGTNGNPAIVGSTFGGTPRYAFVSNLSPSIASNHFMVIRGTVDSAAVARRNGIIFKMSTEAPADSGKMGAIFIESSEASGSNPRLCIATNNQTRILVDSSGRVGIGSDPSISTTMPAERLRITGENSPAIRIDSTATGINSVGVPTLYLGGFRDTNNTNSVIGEIVSENKFLSSVSSTISFWRQASGGSIVFSTRADASNFIRRMMIANNGFIGIGNYGPGTGQTLPSNLLTLAADDAIKPATNTWKVSSDIRLKENIVEADYDVCYNIIKNLPLKRYKWRDDVYSIDQTKDRSKLGWIAQDVQIVFPKSVGTNKFTKLDETVINDCLTLDADQIYAAMYGAVKKLIFENEDLRNRLSIIENK